MRTPMIVAMMTQTCRIYRQIVDGECNDDSPGCKEIVFIITLYTLCVVYVSDFLHSPWQPLTHKRLRTVDGAVHAFKLEKHITAKWNIIHNQNKCH